MSAGPSEATVEACPFCGGEAFLEEHPAHTHVLATFMPDHLGSWTVQCACGAGFVGDTRPDVLALWNRRMPPNRAALIAAERAAWQPIATAPRDGSEFLMALSNGWTTIASAPAHAERYAWWRVQAGVSVAMVDTHYGNTDWSKSILAMAWRPLPPPPDRADLPGGEG